MTPLVAATQDLSKVLFNARHRLTVAYVFGEPDCVLGYEEVAEQASVSRSVAHKELAVLVRIGALSRVEVGRSVNYQRSQSRFWEFILELLVELEQQSSTNHPAADSQ